MRVVVVGAGVIGVTTAWYLAERGHEVTVVDRAAGPGTGASYGNGCLVTPSTSDSWAAPGTPTKILKWLGQEQAPMLLRLKALPGMAGWGLRFLRECREPRWRANTKATYALASFSRDTWSNLVEREGLVFDRNPPGLIKLFRDPLSMKSALAASELYRELGHPFEVLDAAQVVREEPALAPIEKRVAGGILYPTDGSGDSYGFTRALAARTEAAGVTFRWGETIRGWDRHGSAIRSVHLSSGPLAADSFVLAAGAWSPVMARELGLDLPVYPAKGYSMTVDLGGWNAGPRRPIADDGRKAGFTPLGNRLRVAGTVEFTGYDTSLNAARGKMLEETLADLLPDLPTGLAKPEHWAGLRPLTPDGRPLIGATRIANLHLNTGHGPLGWTLACGSALALAETISGRKPPLDLAPFAWPRMA